MGAHTSAHTSPHTSAHTSPHTRLGVNTSAHMGAHTSDHTSLGAHTNARMCAFLAREPIWKTGQKGTFKGRHMLTFFVFTFVQKSVGRVVQAITKIWKN